MTTLEKTLALAQAAEADHTEPDSEQTPHQGTKNLQRNKQDEEAEYNEDNEPSICLSQWDMDYTQPVDVEPDGGVTDACQTLESESDERQWVEAEPQQHQTGQHAEQEVQPMDQHDEHTGASAPRGDRVSTAGVLAFKSRTSKFGRRR